jgi:uncharacterized protein YdeI (YjbR/CyaY-like superfamily)
MNPATNFFFDKPSPWQEAYALLRNIALNCGLTEELKWGVPCYTYKEKNVVLIHGFKHYCALLFHKGVLIKNTENVLIQQTKNVQSARQMRFTSAAEIDQMKATIKAYIFEAIEVEKAGLEVPFKKTEAFEMVEEFKQVLDENEAIKSAFEALTPGRQRGYLLYFSQAKQSKTRTARIQKYLPHIIKGKGLKDQL